MALNEPKQADNEFPIPVHTSRHIPVRTILLSAGVVLLIVLLALSY